MAALDTVWASLEQRAAEEQGGSFVQEVDTSSAAQEDGDSDEPSTAVLLVMQDVARWLSAADLRRARCVCRQWRAAMSALATTAQVQLLAGTLGHWKQQLGALVAALPFLAVLEVHGRLSDVAAMQLTQLERAKHLRALKILSGQDLRDKSLQSLQGLTQLQALQLHGASALTSRGLITLVALHQLVDLDLKHCGRISWLELQQAWHAACAAFVKDAHIGGSSSSSGAAAAGGGPGSLSTLSVAGMLAAGGVQGLGPGLAALKRPGSGNFAGHLMVGGRQRDSSTGGALPSPRSTVRKHALASAGLAFGGSPLSHSSSHDGSNAAAAAAAGSGGSGDLQQQQQEAGPVNPAPLLTGTLPHSRFRNSVSAAGPAAAAAPVGGAGSTSRFAPGATSSSSAAAVPDAGSASAAGGSGGAAGGVAAFRARASGLGPKMGDTSSFPTERPTGRAGSRFALAALQASNPVIRQASTVAALAAMPLLRHDSGMGSSPAAAAVAAAAASGGIAAAVAGGVGSAVLGPRRTAGALQSGGNLGRQSSAVQLALLAYLGSAEGQDSVQGLNRSLERKRQQRSPNNSSGGGILSRHGSGVAGGSSSSGAEPGSPRTSMRRYRLPAMPFPHLKSLTFSCTDVTGSRPVAELSAVADLTKLTSLEMHRCQQLTDAAVGQLTKLRRLARLKMVNVWGLTDAGLEALGALTGLTHLTLQQPNQVTAAGLLGLTGLTKLRALTLSCTQDLGLMALPWLVCDLPSLTSFDITSNCWGDNGCEMLSNAACGVAGQLTSIKLRGCSQLQPAGVEQLAKLPSLEVLLLEDCCQVTCGHVLGSSKLPKGLKELTLAGCNWGNLFTECLTVPPCAGSLVKLSISGVPDVAQGQMRKAVGFFSNLQTLELTASPGLTDVSLSSLSKLGGLRELDLSGTGVEGEFLAALPALKQLSTVKLAGCSRLTGEQLVAAAGQLPALQVLDLGECPAVGDEVVEGVLSSCAQLVKLDVRGCKHVTAATLAACPHYVRLEHSIK